MLFYLLATVRLTIETSAQDGNEMILDEKTVKRKPRKWNLL